jgi:ribose/xylose/arabinose/galactoside ABC-type transport system permease subunit
MSEGALRYARITHPLAPFGIFSRLGPLLGLITIWLLFAALCGGDFVKWDNQRLMLTQTAVVGTAAIGATLIIICGGIDLSVGATIALGTVVVAMALRTDAPPIAGLAAGIGAGLVCGAAIGSMVIGQVGRVAAVAIGLATTAWCYPRFGSLPGVAAGIGALVVVAVAGELLVKRVALSPFIVTLGMWGALRGLGKGLSDNQPVYPDSRTWVGDLMTRAPDGLFAIMPPGVWILLGLALLIGGMLRYTCFGRHVYAVGSNEQTARLCGIHVERVKLLVYVVGVGCAGLAACLQFSFLSMGDPTTADGYELKVIAAVVIGGASLAGGQGGVLGTLVGAMLMTVVDNGCTKLGLDNWVQEIVTGGIIVAAVVMDRLRQRRVE